MEGLRCHQTFIALKLHFTSNYDYFKYAGKTRKIDESKLAARKDFFTYRRLERKYKDELENFIVANMIHGGVNWIGDLNSMDAERNYEEWKRRKESLHYLIGLDVMKMADEDPNTLFRAKGGNHPKALRMYLGKKIDIETLIGLNEVLKFQPVWDKNIKEPLVWPEVSNLMNKYTPFIRNILSKDQLRQIIEDQLT